MTQLREHHRRSRWALDVAPLAIVASGVAIAMLAMVWRDAAAFRPQGTPHEAVALAKSALYDAGYAWARVRVEGATAVLSGRAPDDGARVMAYHIARRALRPLMGQDATITGLRSRLSVRGDAPATAFNRIVGAPALDVASLLPPPMPLIHRRDIETGALRVAETVIAHAVDATPGDPMPEVASPADSQEPAQSHPAQQVQSPNEALLETSAATSPNGDRDETVAAPVHSTRTIELVPKPLDTAARDAGPAPIETAAACTQSFDSLLSGGMIQFAKNSAAIEKQSRAVLDKLAIIAKRCKGYRLTVEGHTDLTGSRTHNMDLSRRRAEAVRWALIDRGVDMDHIFATGYGASRPLADGTSDVANARNRRIAITVAAGG